MRTWAHWTARAAMFTATFAAAGAGTVGLANASTWTTSGNNSIVGGNQVSVPISVPVNACGNALAVLGFAGAGCEGGAGVGGGNGGSGSAWTTSGNNSIVGGNQVNVPVKVPVNICGNAAAVLGTSLAGCQGGAGVGGGNGGSGSAWTTSGNNSIGGGNQVSVPVKVPVNICGNSVGNALAGCQGGAGVGGGNGGSGSAWTTSGNNSIVGGNQVNVPVKVPVNICGNAAAVLGTALSGCQGGAWTGGGAPAYSYTPATHTMAARVDQDATQPEMAGGLAGLANLAGLTNLGGLTNLASLPVNASNLTGAGSTSALPAQLTAYTTTVAPSGGSGSNSLFAVAAGALLAGATALVAAGRRLGLRKVGR